MTENNPYITIATFLLPTSANVIMAKLRSEGVDCRLADENTILANPAFSPMLGGLKVQVRHAQLSEANALLDAFEGADKDEYAEELAGVEQLPKVDLDDIPIEDGGTKGSPKRSLGLGGISFIIILISALVIYLILYDQ